MNLLPKRVYWLVASLLIATLLVACAASGDQEPVPGQERLALPALTPLDLAGSPLKVVATTSIIGDVVGQVGGEAIQLTTLMGPGQDPHSYEPSARVLTAVAEAHVIFVNGWDLEESLVQDLASIGEAVPLVAISANIEPLEIDEAEHGADPHVWFSIPNVAQWVANAQQVLTALDPASQEIYENNAAAYLAELKLLEDSATMQLAQIPEENRFLVTNHDTFRYFARDYNFTIVGTVIPGQSSVAEPSARDLVELIGKMNEHNLCAIFTETTISDSVAQTIVNELDRCDAVAIRPLYTGALGPAGSGADSYLGMFRANVDAIAAELKE